MKKPKQLTQQQFNEVKRKWYEKLQKAGFTDIEQDEWRLIRWHAHDFFSPSRGFTTADRWFAKREYYLKASEFLELFEFRTELDRHIWRLHSEGKSTRQIPTILNIGRGIVWRTVERLSEECLKFMRDESKIKSQVLTIRPRSAEDDTFIYDSFLNSLYYSGHWRSTHFGKQTGKKLPMMSKETAMKYRTVLQHILSKQNVTCNICCLKDEPDILVGYSIFEHLPHDSVLHFVYVRTDWRREGIAKDLVPFTPTVITHLTRDGKEVLAHLSKKDVKPKLISFPIVYEILENTFKPKSETHPTYKGETENVLT